jgi:hypothetical protein
LSKWARKHLPTYMYLVQFSVFLRIRNSRFNEKWVVCIKEMDIVVDDLANRENLPKILGQKFNTLRNCEPNWGLTDWQKDIPISTFIGR